MPGSLGKGRAEEGVGRRWGEEMPALVLVLWTVRARHRIGAGRPRSGASERGQSGNIGADGSHPRLRGSRVRERGRCSAL